MRIGISGAQSTGKTTLLNALRSEPYFKDFSICNEVTRRVQSYGLPINEDGTDVTQQLIMNQHIVNLVMHDNMITDRTSLDGYVYTYYLRETSKVKRETLEYAKSVMLKTIDKYDLLFYIPPEFDIKNDGTRSINTFFRDRVVLLFEEAIRQFELPVVRLTGSVRERVQSVLTTMEATLPHER